MTHALRAQSKPSLPFANLLPCSIINFSTIDKNDSILDNQIFSKLSTFFLQTNLI